MSTPEARKKARDKYAEKTKLIGTAIDLNMYDFMIEYCQKKGFTKKEFLEKAIEYYIDNNWYILLYYTKANC